MLRNHYLLIHSFYLTTFEREVQDGRNMLLWSLYRSIMGESGTVKDTSREAERYEKDICMYISRIFVIWRAVLFYSHNIAAIYIQTQFYSPDFWRRKLCFGMLCAGKRETCDSH